MKTINIEKDSNIKHLRISHELAEAEARKDPKNNKLLLETHTY
ncbi:hypothetical protein CNO14_06920 (plasmid) [Borrelia miyamotoi]|uniref:Uncharacterized protein n=2 Tax=Borrelia miyamotoi TaxID=47466 RepID=A0AAQ3CN16_9SPIR|nr:hypothetical protein [Borrelia miyamotoi]AHH05915.1 hypothetical protein BOM_1372 [Borrelia miyamotoi FR64b]WAZ71298.1 hypothetical protein O5403_06530 [Borrelia miyamotoi]WCL22220.1 hypothetical protein CNO10_07555 [Borrelia miyamotoi]WDE70489.1 hypothetical protein CNO12_07700 [Borrelia miyamotoi]WDE71759.1 hypothetical protein CNO13_07140 [Borrelia miyamotoi]